MPSLLNSTPRQDGFRMPGEFERHDGCWMLWPERPDTHRLGAKPAQKAYCDVASAISQFERVSVAVSPAQYNNARTRLPAHIRVVEISSNDSWMRDVGPLFVNNGKTVRAVDKGFNAWGGLNGGLYFPWDQDELVARKVAEIEWVDRYRMPMVLEGGSIVVDGEGTLITTKQCLLHPNRNPELSQAQIEALLCEYLNLEKVIWLEQGCPFDETDGHVDDLCCFIRPGVVALSWTDDKNDPQYQVSQESYDFLMSCSDARGRQLEVHKIHQPNPILITAEESSGIDQQEGSYPRPAGMRIGASYINFYIANDGVVLPQFGDPFDRSALQALQELMPERKVVGVPGAREIQLGGGNIHCITQQQPSARSRPAQPFS
jgi:agmatine deiminase